MQAMREMLILKNFRERKKGVKENKNLIFNQAPVCVNYILNINLIINLIWIRYVTLISHFINAFTVRCIIKLLIKYVENIISQLNNSSHYTCTLLSSSMKKRCSMSLNYEARHQSNFQGG